MLPPGSRVFPSTSYVDGRKGIDGLSAVVRSQFGQAPLSGMLFVFFSKRADRLRVRWSPRSSEASARRGARSASITANNNRDVARRRRAADWAQVPQDLGQHPVGARA